jgi:hypothetical protein
MGSMSRSAKKELHILVDALPEDETDPARRYLEYLLDVGSPTYALDSAPFDDEPLTQEEAKTVEEARAAARRGEVVSHDEVKRELGL